MHIAKAAGSSVNAFFSNYTTDATKLVHVESTKDWRQQLDGKLYVAGHVRYAAIKDLPFFREALKVTVLRDPVDYLYSHLDWIGRLAKPENAKLYACRPADVQNLARKIFHTDFSDSRAASEFVCGLSGYENTLLKNSQTRYLSCGKSDEPASVEDLPSAISSLADFDVVGRVDELPKFFAEIRARLKLKPVSVKSENALKGKGGLGEVSLASARALSQLIDADLQLYKSVEKQHFFV